MHVKKNEDGLPKKNLKKEDNLPRNSEGKSYWFVIFLHFLQVEKVE